MTLRKEDILRLVTPDATCYTPSEINIKITSSSVTIAFVDLPDDFYDDEAEYLTDCIGQALSTYFEGKISSQGKYYFTCDHSVSMVFPCVES